MRGMSTLIGLADPLTLVAGLLGLGAIVQLLFAVDGGSLRDPATNHLWWAVICVVASAAVDMVDGPVARRFARTRQLGRHLDLMSDWLSFGVAPAMIVTLGVDGSGLVVWAVSVGAVVWIVAAALRLARFAVEDGGVGPCFVGVPTPAAALALLTWATFGWAVAANDAQAVEWGLPLAMALGAALMVSDRLMPKASDQRVWPLALVAGGGLVVVAVAALAGASGWWLGGVLVLGLMAAAAYLLLGPRWAAGTAADAMAGDGATPVPSGA